MDRGSQQQQGTGGGLIRVRLVGCSGMHVSLKEWVVSWSCSQVII